MIEYLKQLPTRAELERIVDAIPDEPAALVRNDKRFAELGLNADEIVHSLLDVMYAKKPFTTIQRAVHIHPTVSELIPTLLGNLEPLV